MSDMRYSIEADCRAFIAAKLDGLPSSVTGELSARLASACAKQSAPRMGLGLRIRSWVIREEDLGFFSVLRNGSAVAAATIAASSVAAPIAGALVAAAETGWNAWRKGAKVSPDDLEVLILLESSDGLRPGQIAAKLPQRKKKRTAKEVENALKRLSKLPTRSGSIAVVHKDSAGYWRSSH